MAGARRRHQPTLKPRMRLAPGNGVAEFSCRPNSNSAPYIWQFDWLMWSAQRCSVLEPGELGRTTCVLWGEVQACSQQLLARLSQSFFYFLGFMRRLRLGAGTQERASDLSDSTSTNQIARIKHDAASTNHMHTGCRRKYSVFR